MKYETESELADIVRGFEDTTIARGEWKHADHLVVALHYVSLYDFDTALERMRTGLFELLKHGFNVDLTKEMPYHETLTVFWMRTAAEFAASKNGEPMLDKANEMVAKYDKDYPLRFYSREYLFSDEARATFVKGDIGN